ncbi:MAG: hypothetical protein ACXVZN_08495 [Gaiellaceae bacterium]
MSLSEELERIAAAAGPYAEEGERLVGVVAVEPKEGLRVYLCAYESGESRSWLALDAEGRPIEDRTLVREAAVLSALSELAEELSGGGDLEELRDVLKRLRLTESPVGIEEAEEAALALEAAVGRPPRVASHAYLDAVGAATRRLERALGDSADSRFAQAMQAATGAVTELAEEVEREYKRVRSEA